MKILNRLAAAVLSTAMITGLSALPARAEEPYEVYSYDSWGDAVPSQAGYSAERSVSGADLGAGAFDEPADIFRSESGRFYIADAGNGRVVRADPALERAERVYDVFTEPDGSETRLGRPSGVFVSEERDRMYIADPEAARILVSDLEGNVVLEITKPDSPVYDQSKTFLPQKTIADKAGNVYAVLGNVTTGVAVFSPEGEFTGFYGANRVQPTAEVVSEYIRNLFRSEKKKAARARNVPSAVSGFDIDGDFIFTCSSSSTQTTDAVKKLNPGGKNVFADMELHFGDYAPMYDANRNKLLASAIADVDISPDGCINCLDRSGGRVFQYDEECNLLFVVGTKARQLGGFDTPAALESDGERLYVLDSAKDTVTVFAVTSFGAIVREATALYNDGYYEEALEPWYEALRRDGGYRRAQIGVASALLRKGDYKGAMKYAKMANDPKLYDKAFEARRREFVRENFPYIAGGIVLAAAALVWRGRRKKRKGEAKDDGA